MKRTLLFIAILLLSISVRGQEMMTTDSLPPRQSAHDLFVEETMRTFRDNTSVVRTAHGAVLAIYSQRVLIGTGAPTGVCSTKIYHRTTNGAIYGCAAGTWTIAGGATLGANSFTGNQTVNGNILAGAEGTNTIGNNASNRFIMYPYSLSLGTSTQAAAEARFFTTTNGIRFQNGFVQYGSAVQVCFASGDPVSVACDVGTVRNTVGTLGFTNGSTQAARALVLGPTAAATIGATPANGQSLTLVQTGSELLTIAAAASTTTTMQVPAGAVVLGVSVRTTVTIPTAATYTVKVGATTVNTAAVSTTAPSTDPGTAAGFFYNSATQGVTITPNLTPGAATGVVRITIYYAVIVPPSS